MDRGAWRAIVHGVTKSQTGLSNFHSLTHIYLTIFHTKHMQLLHVVITILRIRKVRYRILRNLPQVTNQVRERGFAEFSFFSFKQFFLTETT